MDYKTRCSAFYKAMQIESEAFNQTLLVYTKMRDDRHVAYSERPKRHYDRQQVRVEAKQEFRLALMDLLDPDNSL